MVCLSQETSQFGFPCWPPSFLRGKYDERLWLECAKKSLELISGVNHMGSSGKPALLRQFQQSAF